MVDEKRPMIIQGSINQCDVCGHHWLSERIVIPKRCARCKSAKWNAGSTEKERQISQFGRALKTSVKAVIEEVAKSTFSSLDAVVPDQKSGQGKASTEVTKPDGGMRGL